MALAACRIVAANLLAASLNELGWADQASISWSSFARNWDQSALRWEKRPRPSRRGRCTDDDIVTSIGRWSEPSPRCVAQVTSLDLRRVLEAMATSGVETPPVLGFCLVCPPSLRMARPLSTAQSSMASPSAVSGWCGSQLRLCALKSPHTTAGCTSLIPAGWSPCSWVP